MTTLHGSVQYTAISLLKKCLYLGASMSELLTAMPVDRWQQPFDSISNAAFVFGLSREGIYQKTRVPDSSRLRINPEQFIGKSITKSLAKDLAEPRQFFFELAVKTGRPQTYVFQHPHTDQQQYMRCDIIPLQDLDNPDSMSHYLMVIRDVVMDTLPPRFNIKSQELLTLDTMTARTWYVEYSIQQYKQTHRKQVFALPDFSGNNEYMQYTVTLEDESADASADKIKVEIDKAILVETPETLVLERVSQPR